MKKINKTILSLGSLVMTMAPVAAVISCSKNNGNTIKGIEGNIYAARTANIDNLVALGYQPKYVNKQFDGVTLPSYLKDYVKAGYTEKLHDRAAWNQTIDAENFLSKDIHSAFIAGFQGRLYKALKDAGLPKQNIGFTTMGETYVPDMDFRLDPKNKEEYTLPGPLFGKNAGAKVTGMLALRARWYFEKKNADTIWDGALARPTSSDTRASNNRAGLVFGPTTGDAEQIKIQTGYSGKTMTFGNDIKEIDFADASPGKYGYTNDVKAALDVTAESIDRMTKTKVASARAEKIKTAFDTRIASLRTAAGVGNKTALALKPYYEAQSISEIIDTHFAWDPTIEPFFYSDTNGLGYDMPKFKPGHGTIEYLADDVDGLAWDTRENIELSLAGQVDDLFFLKPSGMTFTDDAIKNELKSMTKTGTKANVHVVSENQYYQANFGMMGYFTLMDEYATDFSIAGFNTGKGNWGWSPTPVAELKTSL